MIYFYYGSDTYTLWQELRKLKAQFALVEELNFEGKDKLREVLEAQGLFVKKKLVILRGWVGDCSELIYEPINRHATDIMTVLFLETEPPDKRRTFYKFLVKHAETREFVVPTGTALEAWIKQFVKGRGGRIEPAAIVELTSRVGESADLRQYANELDKLMLYKTNSPSAPSLIKEGVGGVLTSVDVQLLVPRNFEDDVFTLTDHFAARAAGPAAAVLERLMGGETAAADGKTQAIQILGALAAQIRSFLLMKSFRAAPAAQIAEVLGWKEGRVWVNQKLAQKFDEQRLVAMLRDLAAIDRRLKTSEEPPKLLLTLFIQKSVMV